MIYLLILLLVISIITNIIISNSINENFGDAIPPTPLLIYITDNTNDILDKTWPSIETEVGLKPLYYKFNTKKILNKDISSDQDAINIRKINPKTPSIAFKYNDKYTIYNLQQNDIISILNWANNQIPSSSTK